MEFWEIIKGTASSKFYQLLPEKENTTDFQTVDNTPCNMLCSLPYLYKKYFCTLLHIDNEDF